MMDQRWCMFGDLVDRYSMEVGPGERVMIADRELESHPIVHAVYQSCIQVGAYPQAKFLSAARPNIY